MSDQLPRLEDLAVAEKIEFKRWLQNHGSGIVVGDDGVHRYQPEDLFRFRRSQMPVIGLTKFRKSFGSICDRVRGGESILVTRYGKPYVVILPVAEYKEFQATLDSLKQEIRSITRGVC